jgi:hypothetical protein
MDRLSRIGFAHCIALVLCAGDAAAADPPDFERQIAPLLVNRCLTCHQPTKRSGGLDLSSRATALAGGESGAAIASEKPEASYLLERVQAGEMPPPGEKDSHPLSVQEKSLLASWLAAGAKWPDGRVLGIHERTPRGGSGRSSR